MPLKTVVILRVKERLFLHQSYLKRQTSETPYIQGAFYEATIIEIHKIDHPIGSKPNLSLENEKMRSVYLFVLFLDFL